MVIRPVSSMMELRVILIGEDKSSEIYNSPDCQQILNVYEEYYPKIGFNLPWVGYFILKENKIVVSCGFTGAAVAGIVEIAYYTFKEFEGQGIASFACRELISISKTADPTIIITAKTALEFNASTKILMNNGFTYSE